MLLNIVFAIPYGYVGLAIATAISATLNAALLFSGLYAAGVYQVQKNSVSVLLRMLFSALLMAAFLSFFSPSLSLWAGFSLLAAATKLFIFIAGAVCVYFALLFAFGLRLQDFKVSTENG